jgi:hypothetical protein
MRHRSWCILTDRAMLMSELRNHAVMFPLMLMAYWVLNKRNISYKSINMQFFAPLEVLIDQ